MKNDILVQGEPSDRAENICFEMKARGSEESQNEAVLDGIWENTALIGWATETCAGESERGL